MSQVKLTADSGGGSIAFKAPSSTTSDADVQLTLPVDDGTANQYLKTDGSGALSWATVASVGGATGVDFNDNVKIRSGTGNDIEIYHNGSNSYISNSTGNLMITGNNSDKIHIRAHASNQEIVCVPGAAVELYHNDTKQCETSATGLAFPSGKGIDFSADSSGGGMTSELLDDYEQGTWTPTINSGGSSITSSNTVYCKVGNLVTITCNLESIGTQNGSTLKLGGIPYTPISGGNARGACAAHSVNSGHSGWITADVRSNGLIHFIESDSDNSNWADMTGTELDSGYLVFTITYLTT